MKKLFLILVFIIIALIVYSCDCECDSRPDLQIPKILTANMQVAQEFRHTVLGNNQDYPWGTSVIVFAGQPNEFYSVERTDAWGQPIVFYWNKLNPPPFQSFAKYPYNLLQKGETVYVHRCIFNYAPIDFDCLFKASEPSNTKMKMIVKVENGQIVQSVVKPDQVQQTPSISSGGYQVTTFPVVVNEFGDYSIDFHANFDNQVDERDTTNNNAVEILGSTFVPK